MTPDELQALDRMLAEKVMKWPIIGVEAMGSNVHVQRPPEFCTQDNEGLYHHFVHRSFGSCSENWLPTRDIAQAFMVAEKFEVWEVHKMADGLYMAKVGKMFGYSFWNGAESVSSASLAICLAAQAWLEAKRGDI